MAKAKPKFKPLDRAKFATEEEFCLFDDYQRKTRHLPQATAIKESLSRLMSRRGYANVQANLQQQQVWRQVAGERLAAHSRPGNIRGGVWQVVVRNSAVLQELSFQQSQLVQQLATAAADLKVKSFKFKIGPID
jgi:predicted nucleic acid-binding Zn ribbon protein